ncbi:hypothetical protein MMC12_001812 [Toensbergia leucococca]|nr:hypothetical protein [Toensbergia leucococca]
MAPPAIDLLPHKPRILEAYTQNHTSRQISQLLKAESNLAVTSRTIERHLKAWNCKKRTRTQDSPALQQRLMTLYLQSKPDEEIHAALTEEGFHISRLNVARMRKKMGLARKRPNGWREAIDRALEEAALEKAAVRCPSQPATSGRDSFSLEEPAVYDPPTPPIPCPELSSMELKRAAEAMLRQVNWEVVKEEVGSNRPGSAYQEAMRKVLQVRIEELGKEEEGRRAGSLLSRGRGG